MSTGHKPRIFNAKETSAYLGKLKLMLPKVANATKSSEGINMIGIGIGLVTIALSAPYNPATDPTAVDYCRLDFHEKVTLCELEETINEDVIDCVEIAELQESWCDE